MNYRDALKDKKRIVVKIGSSSLTHPETGHINYTKIEQLARVLCDIHNMGKDVILVSSGAIAVGRKAMHIKPVTTSQKQALAAIGQANLMMTYVKLFMEYNQRIAQVLMTKNTILNDLNRHLAQNTFEELLAMRVIPIVNENDTVATYEIEFGDNDHLSAIVASLVRADLLILLSDIDGLYTDDPHANADARFISVVPAISEAYLGMGKGTSSSKLGTGGMSTKLSAARIAVNSGADMVIANGEDVHILLDIIGGKDVGTLFVAHQEKDFDLVNYIAD